MAPQPSPTPGGLSPEVLAWLMGLGPNPWGLNQNDLGVYGQLNPPADPADLGTMENQNAALTLTGKANDRWMDPATILQLGTGAGGYAPEDFQPTYEPVKAPGYDWITRYINSETDPVMQIIAQGLDNNESAYSIVTQMQANYKSHEPIGETLRNNIRVDPTTNLPDWNSLMKIASDAEQMVITDPEFDAFDPKTNRPARLVPSEAEKARIAAGVPNPYDRFNSDILADPEQLSQERKNIGTAKNANTGVRDAISGIGTGRYAAQKGEQEALARFATDPNPTNRSGWRQGDGMSTPSEQTVTNWGGHDFPSYTTLDRSGDPVLLPELAGKTWDPTTPGVQAYLEQLDKRGYDEWHGVGRPQYPTNRSTNRQATTARRTAQKTAAKDKRTATDAFTAAQIAQVAARQQSEKDRFAQLERERALRYLEQTQGFTPFGQVNRGRQANIYGA